MRCLVFRLPLVLAVALLPALAGAQERPPSPRMVWMTATLHAPVDSAYRDLKARLIARGYRVERSDDARRRLVVRPADADARIELLVEADGTASSRLSVAPASPGQGTESLAAVLAAVHDATTVAPPAGAAACRDRAGPPDSQWIPEFFVSPSGRLWTASGGLYAADSLQGTWRCVLGDGNGFVPADDLRTGVAMAFVDERTAILGLGSRGPRDPATSRLHRSTDGGASWVALPAEGLTEIDALEAIGSSVWGFATYFADGRRTAFLVSDDGGATWRRPPLPPTLGDVTHLHRVSRNEAWVATAGYNAGPVFWRTADAGATWTPFATPMDVGVHEVPSYGVRIEEIAPVGDRVVVVEYGAAFVSPRARPAWRRLPEVEHVAADGARGLLLVVREDGRVAMLDASLRELWRTRDKIPTSRESDIASVHVRDGIGFVAMEQGEVYEVRDGTLRIARPAR